MNAGVSGPSQTTPMAKVVSHELPLVAGLCRTVQGLPTFPELPCARLFQSSSTYGAARLQAETFPDNPLAMESIDLLYLNSAKALDLKEPQVKALLAWLQNGGHLVVGVEQISDITGNPWLRELMPCHLTDARSLDSHPQLEQWLRGPWSSTRFPEPNRLPNNPARGVHAPGRSSSSNPGTRPAFPCAGEQPSRGRHRAPRRASPANLADDAAV